MQHIEPVNFEPPGPHKKIARKSRSLLLTGPLFFLFILLVGITGFLFTSKSVTIITQPANAEIAINTLLKLTFSERHLLRKGNYEIDVNAQGYYPLNEILEVGDKQNQEIAYVLKPLPGHMQVAVADTQGEATIFLDGVEQGFAPMKLNNIEAGSHRITIEAERYFPYEQEIEIEGKDTLQNLNVELVPAWAKIEFDSDPAAAEIIIDDEALAKTPSTVELLQGKHNVRVKKSGFKDWQKTINVIASQAQTYTDIKLKPADATLYVDSEPAGANVTVDGNYAGKTPLEIAINPGKTSLVRLYKQGYTAKISNVKLAAGENKHLNITMSSELVDVAFNLVPADARLYINNKLMQLSGKTLALPTTQQSIAVRKEGYVDYQTTITPIEGIPQQVNVTLKSLQQQKLENIKPVITSNAGQQLKLFYPYGFTMGASRREPGRRANEAIQTVELKRPFYLGITEVTNDEFRLFKAEHDSGVIQGHSMNNGKQPVANVSWESAAAYCNWLSRKDSLQPFYMISNNKITSIDASANGYRLPSEAEWAWAARSTNKTDLLKFPWGDKLPPTKKSGNYADSSAAGFLGKTISNYNDGYAVAAPVASFAANHHGLYDMGGNVAEWVHDYYSVQSIRDEKRVDPLGPVKGEFHVIRGASWAHGTITELRLSYRDYTDKPREDVGFRIARYLE